MSPAYLASLRNETLAAFHHAACRGVEDATAADRAAAVDFASELSLTFRREILRRTQAAADAGDETGFQALRAACAEEYAMIEDTISGDAWIGTAEQIAEVQQFARDFNWEDRIGTIDAEGAADDAIGKIDCAYEDTDDGEGEIHPDARARLRAALIDSAERENARRAAKADPSWGPGDPAYDAIPEEAEKARDRAKRAAGELPDVAAWLAWVSAVEADDAPREAAALAALRAAIAPPSPTITYPEQKPPPSHPVQVVRGTADLVLGGLVKGGEAAAWHEIPDDAVLVLDGERRILPAYDPEHSTSWFEMANSAPKPFTWYTYTSPNPSRTSDPG